MRVGNASFLAIFAVFNNSLRSRNGTGSGQSMMLLSHFYFISNFGRSFLTLESTLCSFCMFPALWCTGYYMVTTLLIILLLWNYRVNNIGEWALSRLVYNCNGSSIIGVRSPILLACCSHRSPQLPINSSGGMPHILKPKRTRLARSQQVEEDLQVWQSDDGGDAMKS